VTSQQMQQSCEMGDKRVAEQHNEKDALLYSIMQGLNDAIQREHI